MKSLHAGLPVASRQATAPADTNLQQLRHGESRAQRLFGFDRPFTGLEWVAAIAVLAALGTIAYIGLLRHGGFHLDDWSNGARALYPYPDSGLGAVLSWFEEGALFRPVLIIYVPLTYFVFGLNVSLQLAWSITLAVLAASLFYGVLRVLGVPWIHAILIAGLVLIFPWFDATRYWVTGAQVSLSISIMTAGLLLALKGLERDSWRWHAGAAALYLTSILTYEVTLPLIAVLGGLYTWRVGWHRARVRWAVDIAVVLIGGTWVATHTVRTKSGISGDLEHLGRIIEGSAEILGRTLLPVGSEQETLALSLLGIALAIGLAAWWRRGRAGEGPGWGLRQWLLLAGAGIAVMVLGWTIFIPADPYYSPTVFGLTNRVNGLAGFGTVMLVYATFGVAGSLLGRLVDSARAVPIATVVCLALLLGLGYASVLKRHTGIWNAAYSAELTALNEIQSRYPDLPEGSTLFVSGYPAYQALGVPILSTYGDVDGMVKDRYEDGSLTAYPVLEGVRLSCEADGVSLLGEGAPDIIAAYGAARLIDLADGESARPRDRKACLAVAGRYKPGPLYVSYAY